ncbi:LysR family transcriptional regulator [Bergeriella denitrificans]|uniref:LysR family transcriptional regulator n=1 Tax=Bergeriella denitrificans TaxID=494 RepID=A0A378UH19_BERDE|nr:LysR family transcriptional regulator [Bergeriella denitrificans]STZ76430.1 LysR family transcriptional regulator [Bergeriella denitrificans]
MDINQLKSFVTVAHHGNLTQAAERLFLSQPAVSAQIKAIENNLGTALFHRGSNGMTLTRAGEILLPEAEALLRHKHKLEHFAKTLSSRYTEETALGLIHPVDADKLTALTAHITRTAPQTRLHIQYGMSGEILTRIQDKALHGGFYLGDIRQRGIRSLFLQNITYSLICPQHAYETLHRNLPQGLEDYTWIEMSGISGSYKNLQQFWHAHRLAPKRQILCDYPQTIIDLVAGGIGIAMVPGSKAESAIRDGRPVALIEEYRQSMPLYFIYADEYEEHPDLQLLKQSVEAIWQVNA